MNRSIAARPAARPGTSGQATRGYWPQLDGVRALSIAAVIAYHLGYLPGGWIGVDVFFVLSGYLITTIILAGGDRVTGLRTFWGRRARRLLPAVLVLLLVLAVYSWAGGPGLVPAQLRSPALATLFYTANWQQIASGSGYFAQFSAPHPLQHAWSLAIEEQYYVIWPLLLAALLAAARSERFRNRRRVLVGATLFLTAVSAVWMGAAYHLFGENRAYLGTDTRAWELLLGGALAMLCPPGSSARHYRAWSWLAVTGLAGLAAGVATAGGPPAWVWYGGLVAIGASSGLLIVGSVRAGGGWLARGLSLRPVRWIGTTSYGLYLWHWPAIVLITPDTSGLTGAALEAARLAAMLAAATVSYYLIERPLRLVDWASLGRRIHLPSASFASVGIAVVAVLIVGGTVGPPLAGSGRVTEPTPPGHVPPQARLDLPPASSADPYRVWIFGDSVMYDSSLGVKAALEATGKVTVVMNSAFPGWGLTRDPAWASEAQRIVAAYRPQIVMGTWSWDDTEALAAPAAYQQRLEAAMRSLLTAGNGVDAVILFEFPQSGPGRVITDPAQRLSTWERQTLAQRAWNAAARRAAQAFPGHALFIGTDDLFAPGGRFYTWFKTSSGQWLRARKLDNAHFCPYGSAKFGALVVADLTTQLHLPGMAPGWEFGAWTHDRRYNDPPGACPRDQPPSGYSGIPVPSTG